MAAKRKSKKIKIKGAKPVPCGDEPPDPRYQLEQWRLAKGRYKQSCWQNYDELQSLVDQPDIRKQLYELADKGFKEAQKRKEDQRWPLFDSDNKADVGKDLPQAACILLMFHDAFQESQLITPEMRVEYSEAISELRSQVADYRGAVQEIDLFTICMVHIKKQVSGAVIIEQQGTETSSVKKSVDKNRRKSRDQKRALIAAYLKNHPLAISSEIEKATGIDASDVRHLWKPIKQSMQEGKKYKASGKKRNGKEETIDESVECSLCQTPIKGPFECPLCSGVIIGECIECHYTNTHPDEAIP